MFKFKIPTTGQIFSSSEEIELRPGQQILVELEGVVEEAFVVCNKNCPKENIEQTIAPKFVRVQTPEDLSFKEVLKEKAIGYLEESRAKAFRHGLDMKFLDAELSYDEKKLTFYFSAEGRIDFRGLVSDMIGSFHKIIRLQQIGTRDEAKLYGGFGKCGRQLCCASFLNNLESITLEMAEVQEVGGSKSNKITGCCGKLMCCLSFEADSYKEIKSKMPKIGSTFKSVQGEGKVIGHNIFESKAILETAEGKRIEVIV